MARVGIADPRGDGSIGEVEQFVAVTSRPQRRQGLRREHIVGRRAHRSAARAAAASSARSSASSIRPSSSASDGAPGEGEVVVTRLAQSTASRRYRRTRCGRRASPTRGVRWPGAGHLRHRRSFVAGHSRPARRSRRPAPTALTRCPVPKRRRGGRGGTAPTSAGSATRRATSSARSLSGGPGRGRRAQSGPAHGPGSRSPEPRPPSRTRRELRSLVQHAHHLMSRHAGPSPEALHAERHRASRSGSGRSRASRRARSSRIPRRAGITAPEPCRRPPSPTGRPRPGIERHAVGLRRHAEPLEMACRLCESKAGRVGSSGRQRPAQCPVGTIKGDGGSEVAGDLGRVCTVARGVAPLERVADLLVQSARRSRAGESLVEGRPGTSRGRSGLSLRADRPPPGSRPGLPSAARSTACARLALRTPRPGRRRGGRCRTPRPPAACEHSPATAAPAAAR